MKNKDIAQLLNISPAAVSMALNNKGGVSAVMKKKIIELKHNSVPSQSGSGKAGTLLFCIHKNHGLVIAETNFFTTLIDTIQKKADEYGYYLRIVHCDPTLPLDKLISDEEMQTTKGILLLGTEMQADEINKYLEFKKELVVIDNRLYGKPINCVVMDNQDGIVQAVKYAFDKGHRKIGFVTSSIKVGNFEERLTGYKMGLNKVGLAYDSKYVYEVACTTDGALKDMQILVEREKDWPSLLIVANDIMAIGVMNAFKHAGYVVGKDISVIGFDNMPIDEYLEPPLTSINIMNEQIGRVAIKRLKEMVENNKDDYFSYNLIGVNLVERSSVKEILN